MRSFFKLILLLCVGACNAKEGESDKEVSPISVATNRKPLWDSTNELRSEVQTLYLQYTQFGCWCPSWITIQDADKYSDTTKEFARHHIFIEPASSGLYHPLSDTSHFATRLTIKVKGQFYEREDYPRGTYESEEQTQKAPVFRYTEIEVINSVYFSYKNTLIATCSACHAYKPSDNAVSRLSIYEMSQLTREALKAKLYSLKSDSVHVNQTQLKKYTKEELDSFSMYILQYFELNSY